jgi:hypothetical protein
MKPLTFSTDYPFTPTNEDGNPIPGQVDTRPGTWGCFAEDDGVLEFPNVPAGQRVRITRLYGNMTAWIRGNAPAGSNSGALLAVQRASATANPDVTNCAVGCMLYIQLATGQNEASVQFDVDVSAAGLLDTDNKLVVKRATYLNDTGLPPHLEVTMCGEFEYE